MMGHCLRLSSHPFQTIPKRSHDTAQKGSVERTHQWLANGKFPGLSKKGLRFTQVRPMTYSIGVMTVLGLHIRWSGRLFHFSFTFPFCTSSSPQPFYTSMSISEHDSSNPQPPDVSLCLQTSPHARAKRKITTLMEDIKILKQDKVTKHRCVAFNFSENCV
jgi:hypothetical protein